MFRQGWRFAILLILFLALHLGLRLLLSSSLQWDESEQFIFSQTLSWGYSEQPPLYSWLVWPLFQVFGRSLFVLTVVKMSILAALFGLVYRLAGKLTGCSKLATLASFALLLNPYFAWEALRDGTHTLLMCALVVGVVLVLTGILEKGRGFDYVWLGVLAGLGMLTKYNFLHVTLAVTVAGLIVKPFRQRLLDRRILLTIGVAFLVALPHGLWLLANWEPVTEFVKHRIGLDEPVAKWGVLTGVFNLVYNLALVLGPVLPFLLVLLPRTSPAVEAKTEIATPTLRLMERFFLGAFVLMLVQALAGATQFMTHWFQPFLVLLPVWFFVRLGSTEAAPKRLWWLGRAMIAAGVLSVVCRGGSLLIGVGGGNHPGRDRLYQQVARHWSPAAIQGEIFLVDDPIIGGNLLHCYPEVKVECLRWPAFHTSPEGWARARFVVWNASKEKTPPENLKPFVSEEGKCCFIQVAKIPGDRRFSRLGYITLKTGSR